MMTGSEKLTLYFFLLSSKAVDLRHGRDQAVLRVRQQHPGRDARARRRRVEEVDQQPARRAAQSSWDSRSRPSMSASPHPGATLPAPLPVPRRPRSAPRPRRAARAGPARACTRRRGPRSARRGRRRRHGSISNNGKIRRRKKRRINKQTDTHPWTFPSVSFSSTTTFRPRTPPPPPTTEKPRLYPSLAPYLCAFGSRLSA